MKQSKGLNGDLNPEHKKTTNKTATTDIDDASLDIYRYTF